MLNVVLPATLLDAVQFRNKRLELTFCHAKKRPSNLLAKLVAIVQGGQPVRIQSAASLGSG